MLGTARHRHQDCRGNVHQLRALDQDFGNPSTPVDCNKFNQLVKLHKQACDRRYCHLLFTLLLFSADNGYSASEASNSSPIISTAFLQTADDLALRRHSIASDISVVSTSASTMSIGGHLPILTVGSSQPVFQIPTWTSVEEWTKQAPENVPKSPKAPISSNP
jgi:hypothetical protein